MRHLSTPAVLLPLLLMTAAHASAQASGSASATAVAQSVPASGVSAASANFAVEASLALVATGAPATSAAFRIEPGVVWTPSALGTDRPLVLGVTPAVGDKTGAEPVTVVGANFGAPGAGPTSLLVGDTAGSAVQVLGGTVLTALTPSGADPFGNALARVDVQVTNANGAGRLEDGYRYGPAIVQNSPAVLGATLEIGLSQPAGSIYLLWYGFAAPGAYVPVGGWDGSLALMSGLKIITGPKLDPLGQASEAIPLPNLPQLAGVTVDLQAISITDPIFEVGSFTNLLPIPLLR